MKVRGGVSEHTMLIAAPKAPSQKRKWTSYRFSGLEIVSRKNERIARQLEWLIPESTAPAQVLEALGQRLNELLEIEVEMQIELLHVISADQVKKYLGSPTFLAVLNAAPLASRGLIEIDLGLAHHMIDVLLGGTGDTSAIRPLTEIEEGLMTYVVLEVLRRLTSMVDSSFPQVRLDGVVSQLDDLSRWAQEGESVAIVQLRARIGHTRGTARLILPEAMCAGLNPPKHRQRRVAEAVENVSRLAHVKTSVRAQIGTVEITGAELSQLQPKDVVIIDGLSCRSDQGANGTARMLVGVGRSGYMEAEVAVVSGTYRARVDRIVFEPPSEPDRSKTDGLDGGAFSSAASTAALFGGVVSSAELDEGENVEESNEAVGIDLLNDVPLQISVELGRVAATAEEIVGVKVGHVFDLNRRPGDLVDLSVNGKIIAKGELVEVDGNLGVRVTALAG